VEIVRDGPNDRVQVQPTRQAAAPVWVPRADLASVSLTWFERARRAVGDFLLTLAGLIALVVLLAAFVAYILFMIGVSSLGPG
jgi:hypothetical protein